MHLEFVRSPDPGFFPIQLEGRGHLQEQTLRVRAFRREKKQVAIFPQHQPRGVRRGDNRYADGRRSSGSPPSV